MYELRASKKIITLPLAVGAGVSMLITGGGPLNARAAAHSIQTATGTITEFTVPTSASTPNGIAAGADGNIWFTEYTSNTIGRITPSGTITEFPVTTANSAPRQIAAGPDGNLWFTENTGSKIGKITTSGTITEYTAGLTANSQPARIRIAPNGNLWFTENIGNKIGEITTSGTITEFPIPTSASAPVGITPSADGSLWFTENSGNNIGDISTSGTVTEYPVPTTGAGPQDITAGPDGSLWFTEQTGNQIGKITPAPAKLILSLDSGFTPSALTAAAPGASVEWLFVGAESHGVTDATKLKLFASAAHLAGTSYSFVYSGAGAFKYKDSLHATLAGSVSVPVTASPTTGTTSTPFTITFGTATAPAGYVFDLEVKAAGSTKFVLLKNGVTTGGTVYTATKIGKYQFKARLRKSGSTTLASPYSATTTITVT